MTNKNNNFFTEQKNWSKRKLAIAQAYLASFTKILGSSFSQSCVFYVDGFAGTGIYEDGSKGSALLAAELAQKYSDQQKTYKLFCINVEASKNNFNNLVDATKELCDFLTNMYGTFSENIPEILDRISNCPAYFFIDPFGVSGADWIDMEKIIKRQEPTDLWLRFDHKTVRRLSGFFDSGSRGAESKIKKLIDLYGIKDENFLYMKLDGDTPEIRIENAVRLYTDVLETEIKKYKPFSFSAYYPIVSLEGQNKYYLVFAASHPKAVILASETIYSVERNRPKEVEEYQQKKTGQMLLLSTEPSEDELSVFITSNLAQDIWEICKGKQLSRQDIYVNLLKQHKGKWFGRFSGSHFNNALKNLEEETNPRIINRTEARSKNKSLFTFRLNGTDVL